MPARDASFHQVQATPPFGRLSPRRTITLPLERIHPVIRIAHRRSGPLRVPERIIFDHELVLIEKGRGHVVFGGTSLAYGPGTLICVSPFEPHAFDSVGDVEHVAIHFDFAPDVPVDADVPHRQPYEVRFPRRLGLRPWYSRDDARQARDRLTQVLVWRESDDPVCHAASSAALALALLFLLRPMPLPKAGEGGADDVRLARADDWIRANLHRDIGVADIAEAAGLSTSHLTRLFTEWTGQSPKAYLRLRRVELARRLLADVDLSIKQIAMRTGFKDPFHFSKTFRQIDGLSPTQYREALLAGRSDS